MHVLFLSGWYPSRVLKYNGDFIQRHAEAVSLENKVSVLHIISDKNTADKITYSTKKINGVNTFIAYLKVTKNPIVKAYRYYKAFKNLLKNIDDFDVVHLNILFPFGFFALYLKYFKNKPYIISEHWSGYHKHLSKNIGFFQKIVSKKIAKESAFITTVSTNLSSLMQDFGLKGNFRTIPNVVDTDFFSKSTFRNKEFTLVHISNMVEPYKNIAGMLRVTEKLQIKIPEFKFKFIGAKPPKMLSYALELNINANCFEFIDHLSQEEMIAHLKSAHVFIMFSNVENLPCVILESFSCGTPVIATKVGGIAEYFPAEFGELINSKDEDALLLAILKNYKNSISLEDKMHAYAEVNFSKKVICNQFTTLYKKTFN